MKVAVFRCDACGKLLDDNIEHVEGMEFCLSCLKEFQREIETYVKNMGADPTNDKFAAFAIRARSVMSAWAIEKIREETSKKVDNATSAGFSKS